MSILGSRKQPQPPPQPRPPQRPAPSPPQTASAVPAPRSQTNALYEDAVRFGQTIVELQHTAARLQNEVDEWERRAKLAEEEVRRLEMRIDMQERSFREREAILEEQRDRWKMQYADVEKSLQLAGGIILDVVEKSKTRRDSNINIAAFADAIEPPQTEASGGGHPEKSFAHLTATGGSSGVARNPPAVNELLDKLTKAGEKGPDRP